MVCRNSLNKKPVSWLEIFRPPISTYLRSSFHGILFISSSESLQSNVCIGAFTSIGKKLCLQVGVVQDTPPTTGTFINTLSNLVNRLVLGMPEATANEAVSWLGVYIVASEWPLSPRSRPYSHELVWPKKAFSGQENSPRGREMRLCNIALAFLERFS